MLYELVQPSRVNQIIVEKDCESWWLFLLGENYYYFSAGGCVGVGFIAKLSVNSRARRIASASSFFQISATLLSSGSSGFGALINAWMLSSTVRICNAGLHLSFNISRQILPSLSTLG